MNSELCSKKTISDLILSWLLNDTYCELCRPGWFCMLCKGTSPISPPSSRRWENDDDNYSWKYWPSWWQILRQIHPKILTIMMINITTIISENTDHHDEAHEKAGLFKSPRHREERGAHHCVPDGKAENGDWLQRRLWGWWWWWWGW